MLIFGQTEQRRLFLKIPLRGTIIHSFPTCTYGCSYVVSISTFSPSMTIRHTLAGFHKMVVRRVRKHAPLDTHLGHFAQPIFIKFEL